MAASHQDLERLVAEGRFRRDLYFRLNVYPIALPPLRERREDLRALTLYFLKRYSHEVRKEVLGMSEEAMGLVYPRTVYTDLTGLFCKVFEAPT